MASTNPDSLPIDALALLKRDHRLADQLFTDFQRASELQLDPLARRITKILKIHAQIEEELFYPAARQVLGDAALIDAAQAEHAQVKELIAKLEAIGAGHPEFRPTMEALVTNVRTHVEEEEGQIFPRLAHGEIDLRTVGIALLERRHILMDVLGLHEDDELGVTPRDERELLDASRRERAEERVRRG